MGTCIIIIFRYAMPPATRREDRQGRSIIYTANYDAISGLIVFLMEDCCQGREEVCSPIMAAAQSACC